MGSNRVIHFEQNIPVQLALQAVQGLRIRHAGQWQMLFLTVSGQRVYLPESTAATIQRIAKSDEPIVICKRRGRYDVWLAGEAEKQRARDEAPEVANELRTPIRMSSVESPRGEGCSKDPIPFPAPPTRQEEREPLKPTGTDSLPVPALQPHTEDDHGGPDRNRLKVRVLASSASKPKPPGRVGYGHALEHICKTVKSVLCETGLVLGDGPTQDLISTVFIAAQKEKSIDFDFEDVA